MISTGVVHPLNRAAQVSRITEQSKPSADMRIGQILQARGRLSAAQIGLVLEEQSRLTHRFGELARQLGLVTDTDIDEALALQFGYGAPDPLRRTLSARLVAACEPASPYAEALRALRSQLRLRWFDGTPGQAALAVTSVDRGDGKSFTTANLGVVFAHLGENTLIIDADLRQPVQHQLFGLPNRMGLSSLLSRRAGLDEIVTVPGLEGLSLLPSGPQPPNPQELLGRGDFSRLLDELSRRFDAILIDTPSAQQSSDAQVIAQRAGAAIVVGRAGRTRSSEIAQLTSILGHSGVRVLGATLNEL
jgi:receptor protein-tyrosine kinase